MCVTIKRLAFGPSARMSHRATEESSAVQRRAAMLGLDAQSMGACLQKGGRIDCHWLQIPV
ncbi:hypothetical protein FQN60_000276 [Etheostoma spectabile]|uniref:Uncharacterized protein n=1 Tax=Etheostoma spectabile TaxID=54343 RepID=A0A5J5D0L7_9PERO|nr:hypothetical protein FQN60_000276 [Etheostoma spectabile]